jgi:hypothetical protein
MDDSRMHLLTVLYVLHMPVILAACHLLLLYVAGRPG